MNKFKLAFKNVVKNKVYTWINILGLTIGFTLCLLVFSVVIEENSYDKDWKKADQIYRIVTVDSTQGLEGQIPAAIANLGTELKQVFPEIEIATAISTTKIYINPGAQNDEPIEINALSAQDNFWDILDINILQGNPKEFIEGKINLIISKEFKDKYFKNKEVIGETLANESPLSSKKTEYVITGVIDNLPYNSTLRGSAIVVKPPSENELNKEGWGYYEQQFLLVKPGTDLLNFSQKINNWYTSFLNDGAKSSTSFRLQSLTDIYLNPLAAVDKIRGSQKSNLIFQSIALLVLMISCINFINLYTVRTLKRVKSLNLHKIMGASRAQLIQTLLLETLLIFGISALLSIGLYLISLNSLENFLGFKLIYIKSYLLPLFSVFLLSAVLLSLIVGIYPAWLGTNVKTSDALKNKLSKAPIGEIWVKKGLITIQFSIALIVIVGLITIQAQLQHTKSTSLGYDSENLINISTLAVGNNSEAFKNELQRVPGIAHSSIAAWIPTQGSGHMAKNIIDRDNPDKKIQVSFIIGDVDLAPLLKLKLLKGRLLHTTDYNDLRIAPVEGKEPIKYALITQSTAKVLGITELGILNPKLSIIPVGIVEDFHSESFHNQMVPTVILASQISSYANTLIKVKKGQEKTVTQALEKITNEIFPNTFVSMEWIDTLIEKQYEKEQKEALLFSIFCFLALLISALGVTGLIMQSLEQRTKEIGIRKVLGATLLNITNLFSKDYIALILVSIVIASPIAWTLASKWLEDFAYKIEVQWWFFACGGFIILLVTLITVNIQTLKVALRNPVGSLRDE